MGTVEDKLGTMGFRKAKANFWTRRNQFVQVVHSTEYNRDIIRVMWKEEWKNYSAIIFDYSSANGPVCIVPVDVLFNSNFVKKKRKQKSYANSGYWWSQKFPTNHELPRLVLKHENRWDLIQS